MRYTGLGEEIIAGRAEGGGAEVATEGGSPQTPFLKRKTVRVVTIVIILAIIAYTLFVFLPSQINIAQTKAALAALSGSDIAALAVAGLLVMVALGWGSKASLPGISLYQGLESSATSQVTAFLVPPPGDMAVRFAMYRTYGFSDEESGVSVVLAMIARYLAVFFMPLLGLALVLVAGDGTWAGLAWLTGLGGIFVFVVVVLLRTIRSDAVALTVGGWLQRVVARVIRIFRRTPPDDLQDSVLRFSRRMRGTVAANSRSLIAANVSWGLANVLVMGLALRFSGIDASTLTATEVVFVAGAAMALNCIPIPGGFTVTEAALLALIGLTTATEQADFTAALLLYRIFTFVLPMPIGTGFFLVWRARERRAAAREERASGTASA